jgi:CDP-glycerol glycerophosphotransferase (TagB/SpsB family)
MAPDMADYYRRHRREPAIIHLADYEDTHVTLSAVDAVISPLSTILLEAALHGKPILAYLPDEDVQQNIAMFSMAKSVHFRDFFERVDCLQCPRPEDLVGGCRELLDAAERPGTADRLRRQCEFFVAPGERSYAEQLDELVRSLGSASWSGAKRGT